MTTIAEHIYILVFHYHYHSVIIRKNTYKKQVFSSKVYLFLRMKKGMDLISCSSEGPAQKRVKATRSNENCGLNASIRENPLTSGECSSSNGKSFIELFKIRIRKGGKGIRKSGKGIRKDGSEYSDSKSLKMKITKGSCIDINKEDDPALSQEFSALDDTIFDCHPGNEDSDLDKFDTIPGSPNNTLFPKKNLNNLSTIKNDDFELLAKKIVSKEKKEKLI